MVAVVNTFAALKPTQVAHGRSNKVSGVIGVQNVNASVSEILSVAIWRENLDGVVDARGSDGGFVRVTYVQTLVVAFRAC